MELEGRLEFSLGCLQFLGGKKADKLTFPLILQVFDTYECRSRHFDKSYPNPSQVISVSDGIFKSRDTFLLLSADSIPIFSVISITNVDFEHYFQGSFDQNKVAGVILDYSIVKRGDEIGYLLGKPEPQELKFRNSRGERLQPTERIVDSLSQQLWKQVKEERYCDVRFVFPHLPGTPFVKAQRNALIANSPVFEVQFDGNFADVSGDIPITDTEPAYLRCIFQFIFTKFVPLLSLTQAFEVLYLAKKYLIEDLVTYCKDFIIKNKQEVYGVPDIFTYFEMNQKCLDDDIAKFAWDQLRKDAKIYIRQRRFLELDFNTLESFLLLKDANCHEWELVQALRRWAVANNAGAKCDTEEADSCFHQLLECIRWVTLPDKEAVMAANWPEFGLGNDPGFLVNILDKKINRKGRNNNINHSDVVARTLNQQYSLNRKYNNDNSFVIYTNLFVDPTLLGNVSCLHGLAASLHTMNQTRCPTIGPSFELKGFFVVPSYDLSSHTPHSKVRLTVNLACTGGNFSAEPDNTWSQSQMILTVFSFSPSVAAKRQKKVVNFWPNRSSSVSETIKFDRSELEHYIHQTDEGDVMDVQMRFITNNDTNDNIRASPPKILNSRRSSPKPSTSNAADTRGQPRNEYSLFMSSARRGADSEDDFDRSWNEQGNSQEYEEPNRHERDLSHYNSLGHTVSRIRQNRWLPHNPWDDEDLNGVSPSPSAFQDYDIHDHRSPLRFPSPPRSPTPFRLSTGSPLRSRSPSPRGPHRGRTSRHPPPPVPPPRRRRSTGAARRRYRSPTPPRRGRRGSSSHPPPCPPTPEYFDLTSSPSNSPTPCPSPSPSHAFPESPPYRPPSPGYSPSPIRTVSVSGGVSPPQSPSRASARSRSPIKMGSPSYSPHRRFRSPSPSSSNWVPWLGSVRQGRAKKKSRKDDKEYIESDTESFSLMVSEDFDDPINPEPRPGSSGSQPGLPGTSRSCQDQQPGPSRSRRHRSPSPNWSGPNSPKYRPSSPPVIDVDIDDISEEPARPIGEEYVEEDDDLPESVHYPESDNNEPLFEDDDDIANTEPQP